MSDSKLSRIAGNLQPRKNREARDAELHNQTYRLIAGLGMAGTVLGIGLCYLAFSGDFSSAATARTVFNTGIVLAIASFFPVFYGMTKQL